MSRGGKGKRLPQGSNVPKHSSKQPRAAAAPADVKAPRALHVDDSEVKDRCLVYRFAEFDPDGPPDFHSMDHDKWVQVMKALAGYETQTVGTIWSATDNGCKVYELDTAHENIVKRLFDLGRDDETAVHTLRVTGRIRVMGFLRDHIFHVLWFDPEHQMSPSKKKHT